MLSAMATTVRFNQDHLLELFNEAVYKRMAEEHLFIKTLDEIFQSQRAEISRQGDEIRLLRAMFNTDRCTNDDTTDTPMEPATNMAIINVDGEQMAANGYDTPTESNDGPVATAHANTDSDYELDPLDSIDITIKEESIEYKYEATDDHLDDSHDNHNEDDDNDDDDDYSNGSSETSKRRRAPGGRRFQCPYCRQFFSMWSGEKRRVVLENGEKIYTCRDCKEKNNLLKSSHAYQKSATHKRPFQCRICAKRFTQANSLACHVRAHTGQRPFECPVCSRRFARSDYLKAHMKIHNEEKDHVCSICMKQFREQRHLRFHLRMTHQMTNETQIDTMMATVPSKEAKPDVDSQADTAAAST